MFVSSHSSVRLSNVPTTLDWGGRREERGLGQGGTQELWVKGEGGRAREVGQRGGRDECIQQRWVGNRGGRKKGRREGGR